MKRITPESINKLIAGDIELVATQTKLCVPIINRIYIKMSAGIKFPDIKVSEGIICDGHHRYIASLFANVEIGRSNGRTATPDVIDWKSIIFEEDEWDTPAKIKKLNEEDAKFNSVEFEKIADLLNKV